MTELRFALNTLLDSTRPIFTAKINDVKMRCLLDTGADIPVFCKGTELFKEMTKTYGGVSEFKHSCIGGFGKGTERTILWNFNDFKFEDSNNNFIIYHNLKVAVVEKPQIPCDVILSASMLMKMKYEIDCLGKDHFLRIYSNKQHYGVGFNYKNDTIYIFANDTLYRSTSMNCTEPISSFK